MKVYGLLLIDKLTSLRLIFFNIELDKSKNCKSLEFQKKKLKTLISKFDRSFDRFTSQINSAPVQFCNDFDHINFSLIFRRLQFSLYVYHVFLCIFCFVSFLCVCTKKKTEWWLTLRLYGNHDSFFSRVKFYLAFSQCIIHQLLWKLYFCCKLLMVLIQYQW